MGAAILGIAAFRLPTPEKPALVASPPGVPPPTRGSVCFANIGACCAAFTAFAAFAAFALAALAPVAARPCPIPAPPNAPRPAIKPLLRLPVARPVRPPTVSAVVKGLEAKKAREVPAVIGASNAPATIGKILDRKPASGRPVSGLMLNDPPFAIASACSPPTS